MGMVYLRGSIYWIKYYRDGKDYRESSHSTKRTDAERELKRREGQIVDNKFQGLRVERIRFEELAEDVVNDYLVNKKKSIARIKRSIKHLQTFFGGMRVIDISTDKVRSYVLQRQGEGAENATINRELSALKRMFSLASQSTPPKVTTVPHIKKLQENNVRQGFFEYSEYSAIRDALPFHLKPVVTMAFYTGMRIGEIESLQWPQVNLMEGKITLKAQDTKNKESRIVFMTGELLETIRFQKSLRDNKYPQCPWVFFGETGGRIVDFGWSWDKALTKCGFKPQYKCKSCEHLSEISEGLKRKELTCPNCGSTDLRREGRLVHDFRRTGVRNLIRAGVPEQVAMRISGHKTRSVFDRYNIVNEDDLKRASRKVSEFHKENVDLADGHNLGTTGKEEAQSKLSEGSVIH